MKIDSPRITYIIPSLLYGGAEVQSIAQLNELSNRNIKVQVLILTNKNVMSDQLNDDIPYKIIGSNHLEFIHLKSVLSFFRYRGRIMKVLNDFSPDFIICHLPVAHFVGRLLKLTTNLKSKIICYHHSTHFKIYPNNTLKRKVFQKINTYLAKKDYANILISRAVEKDVEENLQVKNPIIIKNAVKNVQIKREESKALIAKYNLFPNDYYVVPGRLLKIKGQDVFLKTVAPILREKNIKVVFAGYGSFRTELLEIIEKEKLNDLISFTGLIDNYDMLAILKNSIFVIVPSIYEGLGNVVIESYMMGKTVLANNVGGLPEIIKNEKTGYMYNNVEELFSLFNAITSNPDEFIKPEAQQVKEYTKNFRIDQQIDQLLKCLK